METDKEFPAWFENYSEGLPALAQRWRDQLEELPTKYTSMMREPVCLAAALSLGHIHLMHDIGQTMIDSMDGATGPRDDVIRIAAETIEELTLGTLTISKNPWNSQIQYAVICVLTPNSAYYDIPEKNTIRELVALVRVLGVLM
jgi:hypothetical protein